MGVLPTQELIALQPERLVKNQEYLKTAEAKFYYCSVSKNAQLDKEARNSSEDTPYAAG